MFGSFELILLIALVMSFLLLLNDFSKHEKMSLKQKEHWEKKRKKGKMNFIVSKALIWGAIMAVVHTIINISFSGHYHYFDFISIYFIRRLILALVVFWLAGCFSSYLEWVRNEERYLKSSK